MPCLHLGVFHFHLSLFLKQPDDIPTQTCTESTCLLPLDTPLQRAWVQSGSSLGQPSRLLFFSQHAGIIGTRNLGIVHSKQKRKEEEYDVEFDDDNVGV